MIEFTKGNIITDDAEALVNTVNCVGVMGKGIAAQFKQAFPLNFQEYARACRRDEVQLGRMFVGPGTLDGPKMIINFPTKRHWRGKSSINDIRAGLSALVDVVRTNNIRSIAVPPLGCGNGGLNWAEVRPLIEQAFAELPEVTVHLYPPIGAPSADEMPVRTKRPPLTIARAVLIRLFQAYGEPGYRLRPLETQKLAYFQQEAGEEMNLRFAKAQFGPYADNLIHVLRVLEAHFIRGLGDGSSRADIAVLPDGGETERFLEPHSESRARLERVRELIDGFETPYGMELLASTHWVANEYPEAATDPDVATAAVHAWSKRKNDLFHRDHIAIAWKRLHERDWYANV